MADNQKKTWPKRILTGAPLYFAAVALVSVISGAAGKQSKLLDWFAPFWYESRDNAALIEDNVEEAMDIDKDEEEKRFFDKLKEIDRELKLELSGKSAEANKNFNEVKQLIKEDKIAEAIAYSMQNPLEPEAEKGKENYIKITYFMKRFDKKAKELKKKIEERENKLQQKLTELKKLRKKRGRRAKAKKEILKKDIEELTKKELLGPESYLKNKWIAELSQEISQELKIDYAADLEGLQKGLKEMCEDEDCGNLVKLIAGAVAAKKNYVSTKGKDEGNYSKKLHQLIEEKDKLLKTNVYFTNRFDVLMAKKDQVVGILKEARDNLYEDTNNAEWLEWQVAAEGFRNTFGGSAADYFEGNDKAKINLGKPLSESFRILGMSIEDEIEYKTRVYNTLIAKVEKAENGEQVEKVITYARTMEDNNPNMIWMGGLMLALLGMGYAAREIYRRKKAKGIVAAPGQQEWLVQPQNQAVMELERYNRGRR
jgi:hypothetical protein